jgi:hypothetical protein
MTSRLIAGAPICRGDALTVTRAVGREGDCWTFEVGPIGKGNNRDYEVGPLGFALADYGPGDEVGIFQAAALAVPAEGLPVVIPWATAAGAVPLAELLANRARTDAGAAKAEEAALPDPPFDPIADLRAMRAQIDANTIGD